MHLAMNIVAALLVEYPNMPATMSSELMLPRERSQSELIQKVHIVFGTKQLICVAEDAHGVPTKAGQ